MSLNLAQRWRSESGRKKPRTGWEAVLARMAKRGAAAMRERADAERLATEQSYGTKLRGIDALLWCARSLQI